MKLFEFEPEYYITAHLLVTASATPSDIHSVAEDHLTAIYGSLCRACGGHSGDSEDIQHRYNTGDCDEVTFPPPGALSWSCLRTGDWLHVTVVTVAPGQIITECSAPGSIITQDQGNSN